jgi:hypothetical protein
MFWIDMSLGSQDGDLHDYEYVRGRYGQRRRDPSFWCIGSQAPLRTGSPHVIVAKSGKQRLVWIGEEFKKVSGVTRDPPKGMHVYFVMSDTEVMRAWTSMTGKLSATSSKADKIISGMESLQAALEKAAPAVLELSRKMTALKPPVKGSLRKCRARTRK